MKPVAWIGDSLQHVGGAFRLIYFAKFPEAIYVLHAFQKKARKTAKADIEPARRRLRAILAERRLS